MTKRAAKNEFEGTCQACFHSQVITGSKQTLVLHGYQRPGDGMLRGDCEGHGSLPYELSCDLTKELLARAEKRLVGEKARRDLLVADRVETLYVQVYNPEYASARYGSGISSTKFITIGRDYTGAEDYNRNFEHHRQAAITAITSDIKQTEHVIKFYGRKVAEWKLAPEALRDHAQVVREEKQAKAATKAEKASRASWKLVWYYVARVVGDHKTERDYLSETLSYPSTSPEIKATVQKNYDKKYGHLPAFPTNAERAAARKKFVC